MRKPKREETQPSRFLYDGVMTKFWPPRPHPLWRLILWPLRRFYANHIWQLTDIDIDSIEDIYQSFKPGDGVLIAPNHSHEADAHVLLEAASRIKRQYYFMAAWQAFTGHGGIDGFILQRMGAFSVDREGTDRRTIRLAMDLLCKGENLVVFPEGEIHHLNERLQPILDGVAFMAISAQRQHVKANNNSRIWILPAAIRYQYSEDIQPKLEETMKNLENRLFWWKPKPDTTLQDRIIQFGEALLTLKEKEKMGESFDHIKSLPVRLEHLMDTLLKKHEQDYLNKSPSAENIPLRIKALRRKLIEIRIDESKADDERTSANLALNDVQLVLQLFSYPGNYIEQKQSIERMGETVEKYIEDIFGQHKSLGARRATLRFGKPMNMKEYLSQSEKNISSTVATVTEDLEKSMAGLL